MESNIKQFLRADPLLKKSKYAKLNLMVETNESPQGTLDTFIQKRIPKKRKEFACCERKLMSKTSPIPDGKCYMFTRHRPCDNCGESISRFNLATNKKMKVYYLNEKPYEPDNKERDKAIHEYPIS